MSDQAEVTRPPAAEETEEVSSPPEAPDPAVSAQAAEPPQAGAEASPAEPDASDTSSASAEPGPPAAEAPAEAQSSSEPQPAPEAAEATPETAASPEEDVTAQAAALPETAASETPATSAEKPGEEGQPAAAPQAQAEEPKEEPTEQDLEILALRHAKEQKAPVEGKVIGWNQGGFHVVVGAITTFCPRSEMEIKNPRSPSFYLDKTFQFHVIKHQKRGRRIVLSRKALLAEERERIAAELRPKLVPGADLPGRVTSLTDFGAFVDLGGLEGLVHVTELSARRVKHPRDVVKVGDEVTVRVLKVEEDGERISLSMKALQPNPWNDFAKGHPRGTLFEGKVVRKTDFGLFVELEPGLDGMIHLSQLPLGKTLEDPELEVGQTVSGWVLKTEPDRERISLSLRPIPAEDPWKHVGERYSEGSVVEGEVEDVASFGVFVLLEPGLTGLLPNSESGVPRGQDVSKQYPPGKKVKLQIANIDTGRRRISLAQEGAAIEGSRSDYKDYVRQQQKSQTGGMSVMEAAFAKLKEGRQ
jgi:small subunit ribosomal protein S1